ncbi:NADH-ubiquinone oxidoreductase-F iron-sulfur binding region domain-containing protein [Desulfitobacterium hafniense]|uniref:NADH-ubiquinone oxidoreductase-F iron-sulfur binding region domain-containing protein n=1 Tax=Desulfitobacterium hafniense TaxID=49338 RepID=UPI001A9A3ED2|nr:NADH-ubiquinone oxidoreductase-F iron-sulfur binding region domain-containing protein [Desulfitobacterium hafniense]
MIVCTGGLTEVPSRLARLAARREDFKDKVIVSRAGCLGACFEEPLIDVRTAEGMHHLYCRADSSNHWPVIHTALKGTANRGVKLSLREKEPGLFTGFADLIPESFASQALHDFFQHQKRHVLEHCGLIDPFSLPEYTATGGYFALAKALLTLRPEEVIGTISASGLRGRGGGGFPTGRKWEIAAESRDPHRILIANGDEGDPSAYMDRTLMESDPHRVLEGMLLAAYATGAREAYLFIRREYPLAVETMGRAIQDAEAAGFLGKNILATPFSLNIKLVQSAGAFVCGEETAMIEAMEGRRGQPRRRPPYPAQQGYCGHPTIINNVETLANVPWIITHGAATFRETGTADSAGTKIFCLTGDIPNMGCIEVPLGIRSPAIVEQIGGASADTVKTLQIGGPSGGFVPYTDFALDYSSIEAMGAMLGSGGLVVLNQGHCLVDLSCHLIRFMADESCGRCLFCRDGLGRLEELLQAMMANHGTAELLGELEELSALVAGLSACGLGRGAVNPLLTSLRYFRSEYEAHLKGICPAASCKAMIRFEIEYRQCSDCNDCVMKYCPVKAIKKNPAKRGPERYYIDHLLCQRCWTCRQICPQGCIRAVSDGAGKLSAGNGDE